MKLLPVKRLRERTVFLPLKMWLRWLATSKPIRSFSRKVAGYILGILMFALVARLGVKVLNAYGYIEYLSEPTHSVPTAALLIRAIDWSIGMLCGGFTLGMIGGKGTLNYVGGFLFTPIQFTDSTMFNKGITSSMWLLLIALTFSSACLGVWLGEKMSAKLFQKTV